MGMTEQKNWFHEQLEIANDTEKSPKVRINAWSEWGITSRDTHDMAKALRNIRELVNTHYEE